MITELPFINLKEVISKHDNYAEALTEIKSNKEFLPKWYGIVTDNGRYQCPGSVHTERCISSYGPTSLNRFSNLKPPDSINTKYLDTKKARVFSSTYFPVSEVFY